MLEFLDARSGEDASAIVAALRDVQTRGLVAARHLRGPIWEVRAENGGQEFRVLFAPVGRNGLVLLSLSAFSKKTEKAPRRAIELAERRLRDWSARGEH